MTESDPHESHWFIAYVPSCREKKAAEWLAGHGYVHYLPIQKEIHKWSDRKKVVDRLVLPRIIFVRCLEHERVKIRIDNPFISGWMTVKGPYTPAIVRDSELEVFRRMVDGGRAVAVNSVPLAAGDKVRVIDGPLKGCNCELVEVSGKKCLAVNLGLVGTATIELTVDSVEKIQ